MRTRREAFAVAAGLLGGGVLGATAGCHHRTAPAGGAASPSATAATCPPTAQVAGSGPRPERQGIGQGATLWALFFATEPMTAGQEIKVVWRMTGSGELSISATGPDGSVVAPVWGPEPHTGSNWHRPGDEWGTGWVFPAAGCWTISARRASGAGYLVLRVAGGAGRSASAVWATGGVAPTGAPEDLP